MTTLASKMKHTITCAKCGNKDEHLLAVLKDDPIVACSACGNQIQIESNGSSTACRVHHPRQAVARL